MLRQYTLFVKIASLGIAAMVQSGAMLFNHPRKGH